MAARQREISVSEFFLKNRHLLGFDTPTKALVYVMEEYLPRKLANKAGFLPNGRRTSRRHRRLTILVRSKPSSRRIQAR